MQVIIRKILKSEEFKENNEELYSYAMFKLWKMDSIYFIQPAP